MTEWKRSIAGPNQYNQFRVTEALVADVAETKAAGTVITPGQKKRDCFLGVVGSYSVGAEGKFLKLDSVIGGATPKKEIFVCLVWACSFYVYWIFCICF